MSRNIGFWKWLYTRAKEVKEEVLTMSSIVGGLALAVISFCIGAVQYHLALIGIPFGILLFLYGIYRVPYETR